MANCGTTSSKKGLLCSVGLATTCSSNSRLISSCFTLASSLLAFLCLLSFFFFSLFSFLSFFGWGCLGLGKSVRPVVIHPPTAFAWVRVFIPPGLGNVLVPPSPRKHLRSRVIEVPFGLRNRPFDAVLLWRDGKNREVPPGGWAAPEDHGRVLRSVILVAWPDRGPTWPAFLEGRTVLRITDADANNWLPRALRSALAHWHSRRRNTPPPQPQPPHKRRRR